MPKNTATPSSSRWRGLGRLFKLLWAIPVTLLAVAAAIALTWAMQSRVPESGQLALPGLDASVIIGRDDATLPHVKAQSEHDAWFAMGWLHASERGWQLAFNRRVVRGTLSERLGPATLNTDKTLRTLGLYRAAKKQFDGLPNETQNALIAYAKGVNTFFADEAQWLTPEFAILGEDPRALARQGTGGPLKTAWVGRLLWPLIWGVIGAKSCGVCNSRRAWIPKKYGNSCPHTRATPPRQTQTS